MKKPRSNDSNVGSPPGEMTTVAGSVSNIIVQDQQSTSGADTTAHSFLNDPLGPHTQKNTNLNTLVKSSSFLGQKGSIPLSSFP